MPDDSCCSLHFFEAADAEGVKLERGYLHVRTLDKAYKDRVRELVEGWYRRQARRVFRERVDELLPRFARFTLPNFDLKIRYMEARWGSCTEAGTIMLNAKLMQVSKKYIDYVIVHELCHLIEHDHSKRFYLLLDQIMPDWRDRRQKLNLVDFV